eukprot:COSAG05_NODE_373_length_10684_cov_22.075012_10_plen_132_part_00
MDIKIPCFQLFSLSHAPISSRAGSRDPARPARAAPRGRHSKGARDGGAPHAAVGPGLTGTSPPAGKLHTRPGHVRECAVAVGDPELALCDTLRLKCHKATAGERWATEEACRTDLLTIALGVKLWCDVTCS